MKAEGKRDLDLRRGREELWRVVLFFRMKGGEK
jgi:hypothetical protein